MSEYQGCEELKKSVYDYRTYLEDAEAECGRLRDDVRSLARELLLIKLREWSDDEWAAGWGFGGHPRDTIRETVATINDTRYDSGYSRPQRKRLHAAAERIEQLARLAGGWWVSPTEFVEDAP